MSLSEMAIAGIGIRVFGYDDHVSMFNESGGRVLVGIGLSEQMFWKSRKRAPRKKIGESGVQWSSSVRPNRCRLQV